MTTTGTAAHTAADLGAALRAAFRGQPAGVAVLTAAGPVGLTGGGRRGPALVHVDRAFRAVAR